MFEKYKNIERKILIRRILLALVGNILIGAGIALFKTAAFGNDPHSAMMLTIAGKVGSSFSTCFYIASALYFVAEIIFARDLVNIGTFVNWLFVGYFTDFFMSILGKALPDPDMTARVLVLVIGLQILSLGISMYQTSDVGVGPYDALAMILDRKLPLKYFWCRIIVDGTCALVAILMGSLGTLVSFGTLLSAFGFGPFISFYNRTVSERLVKSR